MSLSEKAGTPLAKTDTLLKGQFAHSYTVQGAELVVGGTTHRADFQGNLEIHVDADHLAQFHKGAHSHVPHRIHKHTAHGAGSSTGPITISMDPDREAPLSNLTANAAGQPFPATHEMPMNVHVTMPDLLPGITLRSQYTPNPGPPILRNSNVTNFPPQNDVYQLVEPIELEDVNNPGPVLATIQSFPVTVNPATP